MKLQHTREDVTVLGPENLGHPILMRLGGGAAAGSKRAEPEPEDVLASAAAAAAMEEDEGEYRIEV